MVPILETEEVMEAANQTLMEIQVEVILVVVVVVVVVVVSFIYTRLDYYHNYREKG